MKEQYKFDYRLTYDEAYETFFNLSSRWNQRRRMLLSVILTILTVGLLIGYFLDSHKVHYFFLAILALLLLYGLLYMPVLKAKKGAATVARQKGNYRFWLTADGEIKIPRGETVPLKGDKDARAIETQQLLIIRADRQHTFCLPKRILAKQEQEEIRSILQNYMKYQER